MSGIPGLIGPPPGKILSQLHTCPPGYIFLSQQLQSKSRKAVLLHGKIVFIALENYSMFGLSDDVQKIPRDTGVEMFLPLTTLQYTRDIIFHYNFLDLLLNKQAENHSLLPIHFTNSQEICFPEEEQLVHILGRELVSPSLHDHSSRAE